MRFASKLSVWVVMALASGAAMGQGVNPNQGINWPQATGSGAPTTSCTSAIYGRLYTDRSVTPNMFYTCGSDGWQVRTGPAGPQGPPGPTVTFQTNGANNASQTALNLKNGSNVTITNTANGDVQINAAAGGGSSVGPAGTVQVVGPTPGSFGAGTTNQVNAALGKSNGLYISGDSITQATGTSSTGPGNVGYQNGYAYLWQQTVGGPYIPEGTSGDQEADGNYKWTYRITNPQGNGSDPIYGHELGTNDAIAYGGDTNKQAIFQRLALGSLAWLGTPQVDKTFAQNCTLAGGMAASTAPLLAGLGVQAATSGATASCVTHAINANGPIYACYLIQDLNGGTFTLSLDGTPQTDPFNGTTTWDAFGDGGALIKTQNNPSTVAGVACARLTGTWAAGSGHTILFTVTSATSATNIVWPQWVGSAAAPSATLNPNVIVISPNQQNTGSAGAPYVSTYQGFLQTIVTNLAADHENIVYSDTSNALLNNPSCGNGNATTMFANCYNDAVHPNNLGHSVMALTAEASTPTSALLAVTHWNPQQPLQNYIPGQPLTPYQWFDVNPYNVGGNASVWAPGVKLQGANGQLFGIGQSSVTGMTFLAPAGIQKWSFCDYGGGGIIGALPPLSTACSLIGGNGLWNFFQGSSNANGITIQGQQFITGTAVNIVSNGLLKVQGNGIASVRNGPISTTVATSGANNSSPIWGYNTGIWNALTGVPGFDGPGWQGVPISPTPAGHSGQVYLKLIPGTTANEVGLDTSLATMSNHLNISDFNSIQLAGSQLFTSVQGTAGTKIPAASGTFTTNHPRMTNATGDEVDGPAGFTGTCASTTTISVTNGIITGCS